MCLVTLILITDLNAMSFKQMLLNKIRKLRRNKNKTTITAVAGVRGNEVADKKYNIILKSSELIWEE
jgi:hypothetical protein